MIPQTVLMKLAMLGLSGEKAEAVAQMLVDVETATKTEAETIVEKSREKARERVQRWREKQPPKQPRNVTERNEPSHGVTKRLTRVEDSSSSVSDNPKKDLEVASPKAKRACRIPEDFQPDIDWAVAQGLPRQIAELQAEKFRNYWIGAKDGLKQDWPATWRNWVLGHIERSGITRAPSKPEAQDEQWQKRLRFARERQGWARAEWGPPPGSPGCLVPSHLIEPDDGKNWKPLEQAA